MLVTSKLASLVLELIFLLTGNRLFAESNQICQVPDKKNLGKQVFAIILVVVSALVWAALGKGFAECFPVVLHEDHYFFVCVLVTNS